MEKSIVDRKALAASLLGCPPEELLGFRDEGLSGVVLIAPDGRKLRYPEELLRRAQAWLVEDPVGQGSQPDAKSESVGRVSKPAKESITKTRRPKGALP